MPKRAGGRPTILDAAYIAYDNELLVPRFAVIDEAGAGDNEVVAAPSATLKIRVLAYNMSAAGAVNARWRSNTTSISGLTYFAAAGANSVVPFNPVGVLECAAGQPLNLNLSGAVAVGGTVTYILVPTDEPAS